MNVIFMILRTFQLIGFLIVFAIWAPVGLISLTLCAALSISRMDLVYYHIRYGRWPTKDESRKMDDMFFDSFKVAASVPMYLFFKRVKSNED